MIPGGEVHEPLRLKDTREKAERLAARLREAGIPCRIDAPAPPLRELPPGIWVVSVPASRLREAGEVEVAAGLPPAESCE